MNEGLDPQKYHVLTKNKVKFIVAVVAAVLAVVLPVAGFYYYQFAVNRPAQAYKETQFTINEGDSISQIAARLEQRELINSELLFKAYLVVNSKEGSVQAGVYQIPAGASIKQLADIFQHGTNDLQVTFLEGWRVEEFALAASEQFSKVDFEDFVRIAKPSEGTLFPDTYFFNAEVDEDTMVEVLRSTFQQKTSQILTTENLLQAGLTREEVLTFASIVEREVAAEEDRPIVAGILINRWKNDELIGADATTQYAMAEEEACSAVAPANGNIFCIPSKDEAAEVDWWPQNIYVEDLENTNPYNTRKNPGLPPAPIANPSISAIEAVLNYEDTDYNYYLTDDSGITHYAKTLEEHNANVAKYL